MGAPPQVTAESLTVTLQSSGESSTIFKSWRKAEEQTPKEQMENNNTMANLSPNIAIIAIRDDDLNTSIKKHRLAEWIKTIPVTSCHSETHFKHNDTG